jgi:cell division protein FtsI/penicillin-binding protein 2
MKKLFIIILFILSAAAFSNFNFGKDLSFKSFNYEQFRSQFSTLVFNSENWPEKIKIEDKNYKVEYSINKKLEKRIKKYLRRYRSDYASIVVIDNNTGKILSAVDYDKKEKDFGVSLSFSSTNPAASIFKVVTAANLLENTETNPKTKFTYNGRSSTLYKYQLKNKKTKWTRTQPLSKAFARSNNVIFGKAAINKSSASSLIRTANKFGFNNDLLQVLDIGESRVLMADSEFALAELASGFNKSTMMSPLHGALIASIVANEGILKKPSIVENIIDENQKRSVWKPQYVLRRVISKEAAAQLEEMMKLTVKSGTARGAFRKWKMKKIKNIEVGGKTGSITGGIPYGKRDWFVSFAKPKNNKADKGISVCVMIVNVKKWYVKSTFLAKKVIEYYYDELK